MVEYSSILRPLTGNIKSTIIFPTTTPGARAQTWRRSQPDLQRCPRAQLQRSRPRGPGARLQLLRLLRRRARPGRRPRGLRRRALARRQAVLREEVRRHLLQQPRRGGRVQEDGPELLEPRGQGLHDHSIRP